MNDLKQTIADKRTELQSFFDRMVLEGCQCSVITHDLPPGMPRTIDTCSYRRTIKNPSNTKTVCTFPADAIIVLRATPTISHEGNISGWGFRVYFRPQGWDDSGHNHHAIEVIDYDIRDERFIYMLGRDGFSMYVQSYGGLSNKDPDCYGIAKDTIEWFKFKRENKEYFDRLEKAALEQQMALMKEYDAMKENIQ